MTADRFWIDPILIVLELREPIRCCAHTRSSATPGNQIIPVARLAQISKHEFNLLSEKHE
jgi:hypothetical protein